MGWFVGLYAASGVKLSDTIIYNPIKPSQATPASARRRAFSGNVYGAGLKPAAGRATAPQEAGP